MKEPKEPSESRKKTIQIVICVLCIVGVIGLVALVFCGRSRWLDRTREEVVEDLNGTHEVFHVQNNKNEPDWVGKEVARRLSRLAKKIDTLVLYMYNHKLPDSIVANRLAYRWKKIRDNPKGFRETSFGESSAAYTVNKGEEMRICIRDPKSDKMFEDEKTSFLVILHELAHLMSKSYGHNLEFKKNFAYITKVAVELGLYKYVDYSKEPTTYCSTDITNPPY
jgi:hypothetical protein